MREFSKGQKSKLTDLTPSTTLEIGISILFLNPEAVDISCFGVDAEGKLSDENYMIFYNQPASPCGSLKLLGAAGQDNERFSLNLSTLPPHIKRLV
ncbi:MAG: tellurium resistance TerZ family protein, partial [Blastocatellia bacterium]|nr:tellurium resistance TerZ family protein [Blastocatellia bacterium]